MEIAVNNMIELLRSFQRPAFGVHGGSGHGGPGFLGSIEQLLTDLSEAGLAGLGDALMPGIGAMANVHPILVHFPIALLSAFLIMEVLSLALGKDSLHTAASWMLYLGTAGAAAAVAAGLIAERSIAHGDTVHAVIERHELLGLSVLGLALVLSIWRLICRARFSQMGMALHLFVAIVMVGMMVFGADLGGLMVYKHGVGVQAVQQPTNHTHQ